MKKANEQSITAERIVDHYQQMIKRRHPTLVDTVLIKRGELRLWNQSEMQSAQAMVADGKTITDIAAALDRRYDQMHTSDSWYALDSLEYNLGAVEDIKLDGLISVEGRYDLFLVFVDDVKRVSRIRPSVRVNQDSKYAISVAEKDLELWEEYGLQHEALDKFWFKYSVMLDGMSLEKPIAYPSRPK